MINWKTTLVFLCIFLAGGVAGGFIGRRIGCNQTKVKQEPTAQVQTPPRRPIDEWSKRVRKEFITRLSITPEQETKLDPLFQAAQAELRIYREQFSEQASGVMQKLDRQTLPLLTDEQKLKYEQLIKERQERKKKMDTDRVAGHGEHPPRSDGPPSPPSGDQFPPPPPLTGNPPPIPIEKPDMPAPKVP